MANKRRARRVHPPTDLGHGFTDDGRPIAGVTGEDGIEQPAEGLLAQQGSKKGRKGKQQTIDLSKATVVMRAGGHEHHYEVDPAGSDHEGFKAYKCTICGLGRLLRDQKTDAAKAKALRQRKR